MAGKVALVIGVLIALSAPAAAGPALLFDAQSGKVLYTEDAAQAWHPASLTKLMTAYLAFKALRDGTLKPDDQLKCSEAAFKTTPSKVGLKVGQTISVDLAVRALVIKSANDMAVMLAERIGGSEAGFVDLMNKTARDLGMTRTTFVNPNGLPEPGQISTAQDLAILSQALIRDFPEHAQLFATPDMVIGKKKLASHNRLLKTFKGADGMKTGFICDSGYNVVASATRDGRKLVAVVLGETSAAGRNVRAAALLEFGFQNYDWKMFMASSTIFDVPPAPTDNDQPYKMRSKVMNWSCGWRPPKPEMASAEEAAAVAEAWSGDVTMSEGEAAPSPAAKTKSKKQSAAKKKKSKTTSQTDVPQTGTTTP